MRYVYLSLRYGNEKIEEFDDLEVALLEAASDIEFNTAYPIKITDMQENVTVERDAIIKEWSSRYDN